MSKDQKIAPATDDAIKIGSATETETRLIEHRDKPILQPYDVADYFVNVSRYVLDIAREFEISISEVYQLAETDEWRQCLELCGYTGDNIKPIRRRVKMPPPEVPHTLSERYLLTNAFQEEGDIRFVTYDGFTDTQIKSVETYHIVLPDDTILNKHNILIAFPKYKMVDVKRGIKRRKEVADLNLRAIVKRGERQHVHVKTKSGDLVECVTRNGLVITGENVWSSKYNLVLRVGGEKWKGGKIILLYKHGLHQFRVLQSKPHRTTDTNDDWDDE